MKSPSKDPNELVREHLNQITHLKVKLVDLKISASKRIDEIDILRFHFEKMQRIIQETLDLIG